MVGLGWVIETGWAVVDCLSLVWRGCSLGRRKRRCFASIAKLFRRGLSSEVTVSKCFHWVQGIDSMTLFLRIRRWRWHPAGLDPRDCRRSGCCRLLRRSLSWPRGRGWRRVGWLWARTHCRRQLGWRWGQVVGHPWLEAAMDARVEVDRFRPLRCPIPFDWPGDRSGW